MNDRLTQPTIQIDFGAMLAEANRLDQQAAALELEVARLRGRAEERRAIVRELMAQQQAPAAPADEN